MLAGLILTSLVAALAFVANRRLPYRKLLVLTGVLLGDILLVVVDEQAQEMQLAGWVPTTEIPWLARFARPCMALWFGVTPTVETLAAQAIAARGSVTRIHDRAGVLKLTLRTRSYPWEFVPVGSLRTPDRGEGTCPLGTAAAEGLTRSTFGKPRLRFAPAAVRGAPTGGTRSMLLDELAPCPAIILLASG